MEYGFVVRGEGGGPEATDLVEGVEVDIQHITGVAVKTRSVSGDDTRLVQWPDNHGATTALHA